MVTKHRSAHVCTQADKIKEQSDAINQIYLWLAGNHDPENGMIYKMIDVVKDVDIIKSDIGEIKAKISEAIDGSARASSALERYKLEVKSFEDGRSDAQERLTIANNLKSKEKRERWQRVIWVVMAAVALLGLGVNIYFNIRGNMKQETTIQRVEDIGTPVIINPRGGTEELPDGYSLKMWGRKVNDTIK